MSQSSSSIQQSTSQSSINDVLKQQEEDLALQASDLMESGIALINSNPNPITPALTKGPVIMPHLGNETLKYGSTVLFLGGFVNSVERNSGGLVGSYFILFLRDFQRNRCLMNGKL